MNKKITLFVLSAVIVGSIWYLERIKAQPASSETSAVSQEIGLAPATEDSSTVPSIPASVSSGTPKTTSTPSSIQSIAAADIKAGYQQAIEIADPTGFINASDAFTLKSLIGKKVILVDFWTYSCINCIRTLPYVTSWYKKYKDDGFVVVGIHTPEFDFEKDINNVRTATQKYGIDYPVILDSNHGTWNAYGNLYWPHEYLIDIAGYIVHDHIGEGGYDQTETEIQKLLKQRAMAFGAPMPVATSTVAIKQESLGGVSSPETYFGAGRNEYLANGIQGIVGSQALQKPQNVSLNKLYLAGSWNFQSEYAVNNESKAKIIYKYRSAKVFFVANAPEGAVMEITQDGKPVSDSAGSDVKDGKISVKESKLYNIINNPDGSGEHTLEIIIDSPGLRAYTFTFG